jgi:1-aminocyclopropane-1-carboxylate deaminase
MEHSLIYNSIPTEELLIDSLKKHGVRILVKREDLNHPFVSGNKWWKLKYNLQEAVQLGHDTLLTFGGAYSNHIFATAAAAKELGLKSIGVIRGEETLPLNHTLAFAKSCGMQLHYISREAYREKTDIAFIAQLHERFGNFYLIPEGGTNELAIKGVKEWAGELGKIDFDYVGLSVGTGGTMAGLIEGLDPSKRVIAFSSLKGGEFLANEIKSMTSANRHNWTINCDYHFGGYGKETPELRGFIQEMKDTHQLPLDAVYTGKALSGIHDLITKNCFMSGSTLLFLHTGGLQNKYE